MMNVLLLQVNLFIGYLLEFCDKDLTRVAALGKDCCVAGSMVDDEAEL